MTSGEETRIAQLVTDQATAHRLADRIGDILDPERCAVSLFENGRDWVLEAVFHGDDEQRLIAGVVRHELGPEAENRIELSTIAERDWVAASLDGLAPVPAGRFVIHGAHDRARVRPNQTGIEIEAALAFGTGHHGTTRGCLLAFEALRKRTRAPQVWHMLDIGTGTGVLAIAAARALRRPVLASDIDPMAVVVARENARLNRAASLVSVFTAAGAHAERFRAAGRYDLIFANILEAPLRRMSATASALLAPGGHVILSGLLPAHAKSVIAAYRRQNLFLETRLTLDGWVTLTMRKGR